MKKIDYDKLISLLESAGYDVHIMAKTGILSIGMTGSAYRLTQAAR